MQKFIFPALFVVLFLVSGGCNGTTDLEENALALSSSPPGEIGDERPAKVVLPSDYSISKTYPLVVMLHGYGANALAQNVVFGLKERATKNQFILLMPEGTKDAGGSRFWNADPKCCDFLPKNIDDVAYLTGLLDEAERLYAVETGNVAFVGHSNGGYMSYRMACEIPERIKRIAVLAGSVSIDPKDCQSTQAVSVLHMHGTVDEIVPYPENLTQPTERTFPLQTVGAEAALERWRVKAHCAAGLPSPTQADFISIAGSETDVYNWTGCDADATITLWKINGGDHILLDATTAYRDQLAEYLAGK